MSVFTYHLIEISYYKALKAILFPLKTQNIPGLIHAEYMSCMTLGSPVFSLSRILAKQIALFAQWENETDIDNFLENDSFGKTLTKGWHVRLTFIRQWGKISGFKIPDKIPQSDTDYSPVVAITLARMRLFEVPRFIRWGRPVEKLVRDHPGAIMSTASIRFPNLVSTFSIWKSQLEMTNMVHGHSSVPQPKRHLDAMKERERKDFHFEFTTLRFIPISEFGEWKKQNNIIPKP
ncbi:hypothetical protein ACH34E_14285 [Elizabethkingia anophelis]|uniref:hypothetical protein n=1 Tax=Elizabethkingia anophelis TaxID=1117645 RepID=UPI00063A89C9|nr:hypothetical protein [Elizabethkingia anophelis]AKH94785.1 hypothetical protein M876_09435 [Elizabethkingia anophelis FMS-007]MCT3663526.1 hypothetical protein [Elizabethkingia anophelis]MCT3759045.1 hypothetical protein [Elizabethkingia anophelis]MCT3802256.1 hypothetical protein [Elizabethkingia anophelis]MCT3899075.1 hypothetical protein [Elizabethkingia anophelis]